MPNPQKGSEMVLAFKLKADADHVVVKMYTVNLAAVERRELQGPWLAGWNRLSMGLTGAPSSGLYYVVLETRNAQGMGRGAIARLVYLQ